MFVETDDYMSSKTYALVDGSMTEKFNERLNSVEYSFDAYWIVDSGGTKDSLAVGTVRVTYCDSFASQLDGLATYQNMSIDEVLGRSGSLKAQSMPDAGNLRISRSAPKEVKSYASAIFGNGKAWVDNDGRVSSRDSDLIFKDLVDTWLNLPQLPPGTSKWLKFKN